MKRVIAGLLTGGTLGLAGALSGNCNLQRYPQIQKIGEVGWYATSRRRPCGAMAWDVGSGQPCSTF